MTSVFLADDHEIVRYALRSLLESSGAFEVLGEAGDSESTVAGVAETSPDVLILDMRMPEPVGVEVCQKVRKQNESVKVLVLTSFDDDEDIYGALRAGASGYLLKGTEPARILHAVTCVASGETVLNADVAERILKQDLKRESLPPDLLSERESEVLRLMAQGLSNKEIAQFLWIGETTVKTHVSNLLRKLGQPDRTQAVLAAVRAGLVVLND